ncbi:MAG: tetratricopeptide repeat protein [Planctomycetota bacterium]
MTVPTQPRLTERVLVIGWDAADWQMIRPLMDAGMMPTLKSMMDGGCWGNLSTLRPILSPMLWNSIATGKRADKHGILGFAEVTPDGRGVRPSSSTSRRCKALWNMLTQAGMKSNVVGWYASHPAEPIDGVMVSNQFEAPRGQRDEPWPVPKGSVYPTSWEEALAGLRVHPGELDAGAILPFAPKLRNPDPSKDPLLANLLNMLAQTASVHAVATKLMTDTTWDLTAVYYEGIDRFGHEFMHLHPPKRDGIDDAEFEVYSEAMNGIYRFHDMMLQTLLDLAGPETSVILLSDHGYFSDQQRPKPGSNAGPTDWHRDYGIVVLHGPAFKQGHRVRGATLLDTTPTVLRLLGLPVGMDMDGRPWAEAFAEPIEAHQVLSWDAIDGPAGQHPPQAEGETTGDTAADQEALKQLAALGYIEPVGDDVEEAIQRTRQDRLMNLALTKIDANRSAEAVPHLEALLEEMPDHPGVRIQLAVCLATMQGQRERARELIEPVIESGRDSPRARLLLGSLDASEGRLDEALQHFEAVEAADPHRPGLHLRLGRVLVGMGRWEQAARAYDKALAIDDQSAGAWAGRCRVCLEAGRLDEAVDAGLRAVELTYVFPGAHLTLGQAFAKREQWEQARAAYAVAARQAPGMLAAWRGGVEASRALGDEAGAAAQEARLASLTQALKKQREADADAESVEDFAAVPDLGLGASGLSRRLSDASVTPETGEGNTSATASADAVVVVVSGLPRSGTSLMMQMLEAGGVPAVTDEKRVADASNPKGYFEADWVKRLGQASGQNEAAAVLSSSAQAGESRAVKVIHALLPKLPALPGVSYRVVFMERDLDEVLASQRAMLTRDGKAGADVPEAALRAAFTRQLDAALSWCDATPSVSLLRVAHRSLFDDTAPTADALVGFLSDAVPSGLDRDAMLGVIDPTLYRERKTQA